MTPYNLPKEVLDNYILLLYPPLWMKVKLFLFGRKIVEYHGSHRSVWYVYNNQLYLTNI